MPISIWIIWNTWRPTRRPSPRLTSPLARSRVSGRIQSISHASIPSIMSQLMIDEGSLKEGYSLKLKVGSGTFGTVVMARRRQDAQLVAIKVLRQPHNGPASQLREVYFFQHVSSHPSLVELYDMFEDSMTHQINFVQELCDYNLLQLMRSRNQRQFPPRMLLSLAAQLLRGIAHIHAHGFVHRDLKPENVLVKIQHPNSFDGMAFKIADFGLAKRLDKAHNWTSYVATRWYRSPEQLTEQPEHGYSLDLWSFGALFTEVCNLSPLFMGRTTTEMLIKQIHILGTPSPNALGGQWCAAMGREASAIFEGILESGMSPQDLMRWPENARFAAAICSCLKWDPEKRASPEEVMSLINSPPPVYQKYKRIIAAREPHIRSNSVS